MTEVTIESPLIDPATSKGISFAGAGLSPIRRFTLASQNCGAARSSACSHQVMLDLVELRRLLLAEGYLRCCDHHPEVVLDEGKGGRPECVAEALAAKREVLGTIASLALQIREVIAKTYDQCPICDRTTGN